ncbi:SRR1-like protein [Alligator sinensis]|uniref:SRR1-like protein n=1 Tax=Alligator sinensis TaxID=38654 RepID=A0A1U7R8G5_ALLSI|nr:SRR1-like protein [Alligator sinensis]
MPPRSHQRCLLPNEAWPPLMFFRVAAVSQANKRRRAGGLRLRPGALALPAKAPIPIPAALLPARREDPARHVPRERCRVFDPVFSALDVAVLAELGLAVVSENEEGKHPVGDGTTLFYMIHCGKALYNNLLWSNWSVAALSKIIIVGNSFRGIEERLPSRILERDYSYIAKVLKGTEEIPLPTHPQYADVFNDTSVHWFPLAKLKELPCDTWLFQEEPTYQECEDLEIIRKQDKGSILRSTQNEVES